MILDLVYFKKSLLQDNQLATRKLFILAKTRKKEMKRQVKGKNQLWSLAKTRNEIQSCPIAHLCYAGLFSH